eukprot:361612-Chlamydomonas_euryale.AAC.24
MHAIAGPSDCAGAGGRRARARPFRLVHQEHKPHEVESVCRHAGPLARVKRRRRRAHRGRDIVDLAAAQVAERGRHGVSAVVHPVQHYAKRPHIRLGTIVLPEHLWRHEQRRAGSARKAAAARERPRAAEVHGGEAALGQVGREVSARHRDYEIPRLDVTVQVPGGVEAGDRTQHFGRNDAERRLVEAAALLDVCREVTTPRDVRHDVNVIAVVVYTMRAYHAIDDLQPLQHRHLAPDLAHRLLATQAATLLGQRLDGCVHSAALVDAKPDLASAEGQEDIDQ